MEDSEEDRDLLDPTMTKVLDRGNKKKWPVTLVFVCTTVFIVLLLLGAGFAGGLLAGKAIYGSSSSPSSQSVNVTSASCINASTDIPADWGEIVTVGGKTVPITEWLDSELQPGNIRDNLR